MRKTQSPRHRQQRLLPCPRWHLTPPRPKRKIRGCLRRDGRGLHFPCFRIPATTKERIDFGIYNWGFARTCYQKFFFCCTILLLRRKIPLEETAVGFFFQFAFYFAHAARRRVVAQISTRIGTPVVFRGPSPATLVLFDFRHSPLVLFSLYTFIFHYLISLLHGQGRVSLFGFSVILFLLHWQEFFRRRSRKIPEKGGESEACRMGKKRGCLFLRTSY